MENTHESSRPPELRPFSWRESGTPFEFRSSEDPANETPVCYDILQSWAFAKLKSSTSPARVAGGQNSTSPFRPHDVREATKHLVGLDIAVMGWIVNGRANCGCRLRLRRSRRRENHAIPEKEHRQKRHSAGGRGTRAYQPPKADGMWTEPTNGTPPASYCNSHALIEGKNAGSTTISYCSGRI